MGNGRILLLIDAQVLPYWREIRAGLAADLATWTAMAQRAERIEDVADRVAETVRQELLSQSADVRPWCRIDRLLGIAFGLEWKAVEIPSFATPLCRLPTMLVEGRLPWMR